MRATKLLLVLSLLVACGGASAYGWLSSTGNGSATASTGTFGAPTVTTATPGAGTVALAWSSVAPPASGTVAYYVTRDGGAPAGDCATATSPSSATSCTDGGVATATHRYTVTAVWRSWTATSATSTVTVASGPATRLVLAAATATPTAGAASELTITARDADDNVVVTYGGDKSLTFDGADDAPDGTHPTVSDTTGAAKAFGAATTITFADGVASASGTRNGILRLFRRGPASVTVSDGSIGDDGLDMTVSAAPAATLEVSGYPSSTVAGVSHAFAVTALDPFGNTAIGYTGTVAFAASNDAQAVLPASSTLTAGTASFDATLKTVTGGSKTLTATDTTTPSITGSQSGIAVSAGSATTIAVSSGSGQSASVGTAFGSPLIARVQDAFGNPVAGVPVTFAGPLSGASVTFASSGCRSNSPASRCVATTASDGRATSSTPTANATGGSYGVSASAPATNTVSFGLANTVDTFDVTVAGTRTAGTPFAATITAKTNGSTNTSYTGTKCLVFSGPANSPNGTVPSYPAAGACAAGQSGVSFSGGVATASLTLFRASSGTTLTAGQGALTGTSAAFAVNSAGVSLSYSPACPGTIPKNANTTFTIAVPNDAFGNAFTSQAGVAIGLTLAPTSNFGFGTVGTGLTTVSITTGPATNTFVVAESGNNKTATLTASAPAGFTSPAACTITAS